MMTTLSRMARRIRNRAAGVDGQRGMSTAEYAVGTVAAVAFAAVLFKVVHSSAVQGALSDIITSALHTVL